MLYTMLTNSRPIFAWPAKKVSSLLQSLNKHLYYYYNYLIRSCNRGQLVAYKSSLHVKICQLLKF